MKKRKREEKLKKTKREEEEEEVVSGEAAPRGEWRKDGSGNSFTK